MTAATPAGLRAPAAPRAATVLAPLGLDQVRITGGFWLERQRVNREVSIPDGLRQLHEAGNLRNFELAAGSATGEPVGPIFADSDVYKWLEAAAWEHGRESDPRLLEQQLGITRLVAAAQADDGYLNTMVQLTRPERYTDPARDHEHYCAGHLFQAAVAQVRCTGHDDLLRVAVRLADHLVRTFGPGRRQDVDGHPVVETGLVELYRETGERAYLDLARWFVDARGHGLLARYGGDLTYLSDRVPVRKASTVEGHAVRAVYLAAGAADVAIEDGDEPLLATLGRQYRAMTATKQYVTGGLGARWEGEAFGAAFELPADRAYAETCAAIGGEQWAWRMLLATGDPFFADQIERLLFNAFLPGVSLAGAEYFYVNTLHVRSGAEPDDERSPANGRRPWFGVACCPPNVMRTLASLAALVASATPDGVVVHQLADAEIAAGGLRLRVGTEYPRDGAVRIHVLEAPDEERALRIRVPVWAEGATLDGAAVPPGYAEVRRIWRAGDEVVLDLPLAVRATRPDPHVDDVRGQVAFERGPLVYALEERDQPDGTLLDEVRVPAAAVPVPAGAAPVGGVAALTVPGVRFDGTPVELTAVPYFAWANRGPGPMRVWLPELEGSGAMA